MFQTKDLKHAFNFPDIFQTISKGNDNERSMAINMSDFARISKNNNKFNCVVINKRIYLGFKGSSLKFIWGI